MRISAFIAVAFLLGACGLLPEGGISGPRPDLPGCDQSQEFAFNGEATLAQLGFDEFGPDSGRVGQIWVTADRVRPDVGPGPAAPGLQQEAIRMVCEKWADGSGMAGPAPDDWVAPAGTAGTEDAAVPIAPVVLTAVVLTLLAVSFLAFRREPSG